jgi:SAM-dependent methyltransferase
MADGPDPGALLARYYDLDLGSDQPDVDLYLALAGSISGAVLELAAGTGRVSVPLAAAGHEVVAVDIDEHMLARADAAWQAADQAGTGSLTTIVADITQLELGRRFGLVLLALNTLLLLGDRDRQLAVLRAMCRHLAADGRAVIDVWLPTPEDLALYDGRLVLDWLRTDPDSGALVAKLWSASHLPAHERAEVETFFDSWPAGGGQLLRTSRHDELQFISAYDLEGMIERAGMRVIHQTGDYSMGAFGPNSERMLLVCGLL